MSFFSIGAFCVSHSGFFVSSLCEKRMHYLGGECGGHFFVCHHRLRSFLLQSIFYFTKNYFCTLARIGIKAIDYAYSNVHANFFMFFAMEIFFFKRSKNLKLLQKEDRAFTIKHITSYSKRHVKYIFRRFWTFRHDFVKFLIYKSIF